MLAAKDYIHPTYTPKLIFQILKHGISCLLWFICFLFIVFIEPGWGLYISYVRVICETSQAWRKDDERCHSWQSKTRHDSFTSSYIFVDHKMLHMTKSVKRAFSLIFFHPCFSLRRFYHHVSAYEDHMPHGLELQNSWDLESPRKMRTTTTWQLTTWRCKWQLDSNVRTTGLKNPINTHISTYETE